MVEEEILVRIVAASAAKPGDLIVEDSSGNRRLFIGSTGTLSRGQLNPDFIDALLQRQRWDQVSDEHWYSLESLREHADRSQRDAERTGARRIVAAIGGRSRP